MKFGSVLLEASRSLRGVNHVLEMKVRMAVSVSVIVLKAQQSNMATPTLTVRMFRFNIFFLVPSPVAPGALRNSSASAPSL